MWDPPSDYRVPQYILDQQHAAVLDDLDREDAERARIEAENSEALLLLSED